MVAQELHLIAIFLPQGAIELEIAPLDAGRTVVTLLPVAQQILDIQP